MTLYEAAIYLHVGIAPAVTLFALLYVFKAKWWRTLLGKALAVNATGMMLLVDIALVNLLLGREAKDIVRVVVYAVIFAGSWLLLIAFIRERVAAARARQQKGVTTAEPADVPPPEF